MYIVLVQWYIVYAYTITYTALIALLATMFVKPLLLV